MTVSQPSIIVVGDGVIGLAVTVNLLSRGCRVHLLAPGFHGAASPASAGLLAPSVERTHGPAQAFADAARDAWTNLSELTKRSAAPPFEIKRDGIMRVARTEDEVDGVRATMRDKDTWLTSQGARARVSSLGPIAGAALLAGDGVVNVPHALAALWSAVRAHPSCEIFSTSATTVSVHNWGVRVRIGDGRDLDGDRAVMAAGAWTTTIKGLPREVPVSPLRGVMLAVDGDDVVPFPVYDAAGHVYVFPRHGRTVIGATSDDVGFDASAPEEAATALLKSAIRILPVLAKRTRHAPWAGLRPMTPDTVPMLGPDPDAPAILYACGHSRNGFLEAAITGEVIAAMVLGEHVAYDVSLFSPGRFSGR